MLFNSLEYLLFLPAIGLAYFLLPHKYRWFLLLVASYFFYASWKLEYAVLILVSTAIDYWAGIKMAGLADQQSRKKYLYLSLLGNLGMLFGFKYLGFFSGLLGDVLESTNLGSIPELNILLPIGISFYTFQSLSYTIDVYRGKKLPEKHFGIFALYVAFFPQLVAGPIEQSTRLLPQLQKKQVPDLHRIVEGGKLILWGLFKKLVIADNIAIYVNYAYQYPSQLKGGGWLVIAGAFIMQLYMDFSAYSDIAIGSARIFGIELTTNFDRPLKTTNIRHFWRQWHISLSDWLFEYLYKPLRRNRGWNWPASIFLFFLIAGLWHGAGVNFIIFGLIHAVFYILSKAWFDWRRKQGKKAGLPLLIGWFWVFLLNSLGGIFFRAPSVDDSWYVLQEIGSGTLTGDFSLGALPLQGRHLFAIFMGLVLVYVLHNLPKFDPRKPFAGVARKPVRWGIYYVILVLLVLFGQASTESFFYFQF